tara:strand:+ start:982 stop:1149 length:168 start_codon:yes stop_codon:yes gene_type:complete
MFSLIEEAFYDTGCGSTYNWLFCIDIHGDNDSVKQRATVVVPAAGYVSAPLLPAT